LRETGADDIAGQILKSVRQEADGDQEIFKSIVDPICQADPTFRSKRIYSPLTAIEIYRRLQADKGYRVSDLPTVRTIRNKPNKLGIRPQRVKKCEPIRKIPETDAIFTQVKTINSNTDKAHNALRISLDCKAVVKIGHFSKGGKNRIEQKASDHDFEPDQTLIPFGIFIPELCESHFWFSIGPVTADFMVERVQEKGGIAAAREPPFQLLDRTATCGSRISA
jgi:hypothetical protein